MKIRQHRWFLGAGIVAAALASLCCLGPLVLLGLGLGSFAAASWFAEWRPVLLFITFALLAAGWFFALRRQPIACTDDVCAASPRGSRTSLLFLSLATLGAMGFAAYPWFAGRLAAAVGGFSDSNDEATAANVQTLNLRIPSMDCEACAAGIAATLRREPGVCGASVTYATRQAVVRFDPALTSLEGIRAAIDATGFPAASTPQAPGEP